MKTLLKISKNILLNLMFYVGTTVAQSVSWTANESPELNFPAISKAVQLTAPGGFVYVTGTRTDASRNSFIVTELFDPTGKRMASVQSGDPLQSVPFANSPVKLLRDAHGYIIVVGSEYINDYWGYEVVILKYDAMLNPVWKSIAYTGAGYADEAMAALIDADNNIVVAGIMPGNAQGRNKIFIRKYDPRGDLISVANPDGGADNRFLSICGLLSDKAGNLYLGGTAVSRSKANRMFVAKLNASGNIDWRNFADATKEPLNDDANTLCFDKAGNICIAGSTETELRIAKNILAKFDTDGEKIVTKVFGIFQKGKEGIWKVMSDNTGSLFAISYYAGEKQITQQFVVYKLSPAGVPEKINQQQGRVEDAILSDSGCLWIAGSLDNSKGFVYNICASSAKVLYKVIEEPDSKLKLKDASLSFKSIAANSNGEVFVCGNVEGFNKNKMMSSAWVVKKLNVNQLVKEEIVGEVQK